MPEASDQSKESLACGKLAGKMRGWRDLTRERERERERETVLCSCTVSRLPTLPLDSQLLTS